MSASETEGPRTAREVQAGENEANSPLWRFKSRQLLALEVPAPMLFRCWWETLLWRSRAAHLALEGVSACFGGSSPPK